MLGFQLSFLGEADYVIYYILRAINFWLLSTHLIILKLIKSWRKYSLTHLWCPQLYILFFQLSIWNQFIGKTYFHLPISGFYFREAWAIWWGLLRWVIWWYFSCLFERIIEDSCKSIDGFSQWCDWEVQFFHILDNSLLVQGWQFRVGINLARNWVYQVIWVLFAYH